LVKTPHTDNDRPRPDAAILLPLYDFILLNKLVAVQLVTNVGDEKNPLCGVLGLLSFASYLFQHAHRSYRAATYAHLVLIILRVMLEDTGLSKRLCEIAASTRLCRQRPPYLPLTKSSRPLAAILIDVMVDCLNHNLRTKLDLTLYLGTIGVLLRTISFLAKTRTKLVYHWPELWRSLLSFVRFLTQYADHLKGLRDTDKLAHDTVNLITMCLTQGELFLPDTNAMDDLLYKIVESSFQLSRFRDAYGLKKSAVAENMAALIGASEHFKESLDAASGKTKNVSTVEVMKTIKDGYETLSLDVRVGTDQWQPYREVDHKVELKRIARVVATDARLLGVPIG